MKIDKNIPFYGVNTCWAWLSEMEVGDSVLITDADADSMHFKSKDVMRNNIMRQLQMREMKGKSRRLSCGDIRLWRIK
jgi:hypothetical protein